nr:tannase [Lachnospiraceae bacterium]
GGPGGGQGGPGNGEKPDGAPTANTESTEANGANDLNKENTDQSELNEFEAADNITRNTTSSGVSISGTYETAEDYIAALNANGEWVTYDSATNTAKITSVADFVKALKSASKNLGAFDQFDAGQGENTLFGYGDGNGAHYDAELSEILADIGSSYSDAYASDLAKTDSLGNSVEYRLNMYSPLYYLLESEAGYQSANVAKRWRIRTGIAQGDTSLTTEMNLALALENYATVEDVDFESVWGQGHTMAERTGDSTTNFIEWVKDCTSK